MKNKNIYGLFLILVIIIIIGGYFTIEYVKKEKSNNISSEYTPQEEIAENRARQTIVTLYFQDKETKEINPEAQMVDIKEFMTMPYDKLINLLLKGPKNEKLEKIIPDNTKLLGTKLENDCITLDFSVEFLNYNKDSENSKNNLIKSIVNTLTELTEINKVKILINGEKNAEFNEVYERK